MLLAPTARGAVGRVGAQTHLKGGVADTPEGWIRAGMIARKCMGQDVLCKHLGYDVRILCLKQALQSKNKRHRYKLRELCTKKQMIRQFRAS